MTDTVKIKDRINDRLDSFVDVILVLGDMSLGAQQKNLKAIEVALDGIISQLMGIVMGAGIDPTDLVRRFADRALEMTGTTDVEEKDYVYTARDMCIEVIRRMQEDVRAQSRRDMQA